MHFSDLIITYLIEKLFLFDKLLPLKIDVENEPSKSPCQVEIFRLIGAFLALSIPARKNSLKITHTHNFVLFENNAAKLVTK